MSLDHGDLLILLLLLVAVAALLTLAPISRIPYPILLVLGGLGIGLVPWMPAFELPPELVLVALLPPLLYSAAFFTPLAELRANVRPIGLLAIGLVIVTTVAVAAVAHAAVPELTWSSAFVLGAIVSPTDPVAATAIARRLGIPRRLVTIVEGESLLNDGTALVAYKFAVAAVVTGAFSLGDAALAFVGSVIGGVAVGLAVGWLVRQVRRHVHHPPTEITLALLSGYFAYLPAELLHASGVLAVVTVGVYMGSHTSELTTAETRLQGDAVWEITTFVLNALLFVLIGLQLPVIVDALGDRSVGALAAHAALVTATVVLVRFLWVYPATYVPRLVSRRLRERDPSPPWQAPTLIGWTGMRGAVSLAAALAVPLETDAGDPFPGRDLILFLTFSVILATLVVEGLSLPAVIRMLGLRRDADEESREEALARIRATEAGLARLEELLEEEWVREDTAERLRGAYRFRRNRFAARFDDGDDGAIEERSRDYQRLRRALLDAERAALDDLRREGLVGEDVVQRIRRDVDLEESRLDLG